MFLLRLEDHILIYVALLFNKLWRDMSFELSKSPNFDVFFHFTQLVTEWNLFPVSNSWRIQYLNAISRPSLKFYQKFRTRIGVCQAENPNKIIVLASGNRWNFLFGFIFKIGFFLLFLIYIIIAKNNSFCVYTTCTYCFYKYWFGIRTSWSNQISLKLTIIVYTDILEWCKWKIFTEFVVLNVSEKWKLHTIIKKCDCIQNMWHVIP